MARSAAHRSGNFISVSGSADAVFTGGVLHRYRGPFCERMVESALHRADHLRHLRPDGAVNSTSADDEVGRSARGRDCRKVRDRCAGGQHRNAGEIPRQRRPGVGGQGLPGRAQIEEQLERMPGKQLVLVRYLKNHSMHQELVYNGADIDGSKIVWARELDAEQNARLAEYFSDRKIWLVRVSFFGALLEPYSPEGIHSAPETGE